MRGSPGDLAKLSGGGARVTDDDGAWRRRRKRGMVGDAMVEVTGEWAGDDIWKLLSGLASPGMTAEHLVGKDEADDEKFSSQR